MPIFNMVGGGGNDLFDALKILKTIKKTETLNVNFVNPFDSSSDNHGITIPTEGLIAIDITPNNVPKTYVTSSNPRVYVVRAFSTEYLWANVSDGFDNNGAFVASLEYSYNHGNTELNSTHDYVDSMTSWSTPYHTTNYDRHFRGTYNITGYYKDV